MTSVSGKPGDGDAPVLRQLSVRAVVEVFLRSGAVSRADLAKITGLSKQTTSEVIRDLEERGLARSTGRTVGRVGRTAVTYELDAAAGFVSGADLGATNTRLALADLSGRLVGEIEVPTDRRGGNEAIERLATARRDLVARLGIDPARVRGAAVAVPGVVDPRDGRLSLAPNFPGSRDVDLPVALRRCLDCDVVIENDVNCAALGENWRGRGGGASSLAFIRFGTGIGMGMLINGKLLRGASGAAGEVAYLPFGTDPFSPVGLERGALECALGAAGIIQRHVMAGGEPGIDAREIVARSIRGDAPARAALTEAARTATLLVVAVQAMFDPERIVIGGDIGHGAGFADLIRETLPQCTRRPVAIEESSLGRRASMIGAVGIALERLHDALFAPRDLPGRLRLPSGT